MRSAADTESEALRQSPGSLSLMSPSLSSLICKMGIILIYKTAVKNKVIHVNMLDHDQTFLGLCQIQRGSWQGEQGSSLCPSLGMDMSVPMAT